MKSCNLKIGNISSECSNVQPINSLKSIVMDRFGNCYDEHNNYIGKGILKNGIIEITK